MGILVMRFFKAKLARPVGLEPTTSSFEGWHSIQLSYGRAFSGVTVTLSVTLRARMRFVQVRILPSGPLSVLIRLDTKKGETEPPAPV